MSKEQFRGLPLDVLLTKKCNADCLFCIEKTTNHISDTQSWEDFSNNINRMIDENMVLDPLLLGGEPLYFKGIVPLIKSLKKPPIITTNGHRLVHDQKFLEEFKTLNIKALNISLPHYDENKRATVMGDHLFSNTEVRAALQALPFSKRINALLMKGYIDSIPEIEKMARFCREIGIAELKIGELTGINTDTHDFISKEVTTFNREHYVPIPDPTSFDICHKEGGTHLWKIIHGVKVYFNAPPDKAMAGGKDESGDYYHRVLFNDGKIGYSWRREDGVSKLSDHMSQ